MTSASTTSLVIIQPTPFCNINCSYCYLPQRSDKSRLSEFQIRAIFETLFHFPTISDRISIVWHAGEPLVLGVNYYREAFRCIEEVRPRNLVVDHAMQTNGILVTSEWCDFFKEHNVGIGLSIDGPKHIHDSSRKTRSGKGTFDATIGGLKTLQRNDVPFYVISVLTKSSIEEPVSMFNFFEEHNITDVGFNIEEEEGTHTTSTLAHVGQSKFADFMRRFTAQMETRKFSIAVREFEQMLAAIRGIGEDAPPSNQIEPFGIVSVDVRGEVYTFSPELIGYKGRGFNSFSIGNIFFNTFDELARSSTLQKMHHQINEGVAMCKSSCEYFPVCGGGAPANKLFENGSFASTETLACRLGRKWIADFVLEQIESRFPNTNLP